MELEKEFLDSLKNTNIDTKKLEESFAKKQFLGVRFNKQKFKNIEINAQNMQNFMQNNDILCNLRPISWCNNGFYYSEKTRLGKHIFHELGLYYLQEPSAMSPVEFLDIQPNDFVLDLCAAPGGKTTQIANKLENGFVLANEIVPSRAKILCENVQRLGIKNCIVTNNSPQELENKFKCFFDKILVDAPCSGEGMFRKNNDAILEWNINSPKQCMARQIEIVKSAYKMLKPNGKMVYSTCTFSLEENETVVKFLLDSFDDLELVEIDHKKYGFENGVAIDCNDSLKKCARLYPYNIDGEGHFFAVLHKKDNDSFVRRNKQTQKFNKQHIAIFEKFLSKYSSNKYDNYVSIGDYLYAGCPVDIDRIKVLNAGIFLGEFKKDIFIPSWHFAHTLEKDEFKSTLELTEAEAKQYIMGLEVDTNLSDGWVLLTYKSFPLCFGKVVAGKVKNHYPKYLRKQL